MTTSNINLQSFVKPSSELLGSFLRNGSQKYSRFYFGSGAVVMKDRCIPMEAVSSVVVIEPPQSPLAAAIVLLVFGGILYLGAGTGSYYGHPVMALFGGMFFLFGMVLLISAILILIGRSYSIRMNLNNGQWIQLSTKDALFPQKVLFAFCECVENRNACFVADFSKLEIRREAKKEVATMFQEINQYYGENNVTNISGNAGNIVLGDNNGIIQQTVNGLTHEEWGRLLRFFEEQSRITAETNEQMAGIYKDLIEMAKKHDGKGIVHYLSSIGKTAAKTVIDTMAVSGVQQLLVALYHFVKGG